MSRRAPSWLAREVGDAYTLHFWPPYGDPAVQQARHYTGWARAGKLRQRLTDHVLGRGARLTQVQQQAGGTWVVADVERGVTRDREAQLKERGASRRCSVCQAQRAVEAGRMTTGEALAKSGWDRAGPHERGVLLEIFGLAAPPDLAACTPARPAPPGPAPFVPEPRAPAPPEPVPDYEPETGPAPESGSGSYITLWGNQVNAPTQAQLDEIDALIDVLVAGWKAEAASTEAAAAEPQASGTTPAGIVERGPGRAAAPASQTPGPGDLPGRDAETELEASA